MDPIVASLILSLLALTAALAAVARAWLRSRVSAESEKFRATLDAGLRELAEAHGRSQSEWGLRLGARLEESRAAVVDLLGVRLRELQQSQTESADAARRAQDEGLLRLEGVVRQLLERTVASQSDLERRVLASGSAQAEQGARTGAELRDHLVRSLSDLGERQSEAFRRLEERVGADLLRVRSESEAKLEAIRRTVDERLHQTLEARLGESFRAVSERLEQVHRGLGEMQALASGVGDLKRVLTNVRSRGAFGEVQLEALLEQILARAQYDKNVATVPGSRDRVEFAIRLPGRDEEGSVVYLPIDAKFPQDDYSRLQDAYEAGDAVAADEARRALRTRFLAEAVSIRAKYLHPPATTDFALLFVPTEGLYAEALRIPGLADAMQRESHVVLVGPTTLYAVLSSLQMGFHSLAIEKRSAEVWRVLGAVKTEFGKFGHALGEVRKKLQEATGKLDLSERRSRAMERTLRSVAELPRQDAEALLALPGEPEGG